MKVISTPRYGWFRRTFHGAWKPQDAQPNPGRLALPIKSLRFISPCFQGV